MNKSDCLLGNNIDSSARRKCRPSNCLRCGWNQDEAAYRKKLLDRNGLTDLHNGLKGLYIPIRK